MMNAFLLTLFLCNSVSDFSIGLPPTSLTVDKINVYWSNIGQDRVYSVNKMNPEDTGIKKFHLQSARSLKAIGKSLQPYPTWECLIPRSTSYTAKLVKSLVNSIKIKLPEPEPQHECQRYNLPGTLYTIYVTECSEKDHRGNCNGKEKSKLQTYAKEIEANNLKPFTMYSFQLGLSNYYADLEGFRPEIGPQTILKTEAGAPTRPENVAVQPLTPTQAVVSWLPPRVLNGEAVRYEIHWRSVEPVNRMRHKGEQEIKHAEQSPDGKLSAMLQLHPGQEYLVSVRAYSMQSNNSHNESLPQLLKMYPEPNNLTVINIGVDSMNLSWIPSSNFTTEFSLKFAVVGVDKWQVAPNPVVFKDRMEFRIGNLQPRTMYKFTFVLKYPAHNQDYYWPADPRFTFQTLGN